MRLFTRPRYVLCAISLLCLAFIALKAASAICGQESEPELYVNLQEFPLYLKQGFDPGDSVHPVLTDGAWRKKYPFSHVIVSQLGLPGLPRRTFLSPFAEREREFTFVIPFDVHGLVGLRDDLMPGLFLAGIGDNWEIYLNGKLIRAEMHLEQGSLRIMEHRSRRNVFFPFPPGLLREGDNLLTFRIVGDPTDKTVGFQYSAPFYIADYQYIEKKSSESLEMILIGGYLLVAMYHLLLFSIRRKDVHNLYCGLFAALMGCYYLFRTYSIYTYISDTALVVRIEFFCIFLVIPALGAFSETLCAGRVSRVTKAYSAVFALLALSQLALPRSFGSDALVVWQGLGIAALLYILIVDIILVFLREVKSGREQAVLRGASPPGLVHFFTETYAGNLLIAVGFMVLCAIVDILDSLFFHYSLHLTRYWSYLFVLSITLMLARIYGRLNNALQAKRMFLANMSHEIRTPLNIILGMAELTLRENPVEHIREKIGQIKKAGNLLTSIINDILDFSRLETGKVAIINVEYNLADLIHEVGQAVTLRLAEKEVSFAASLDPAIPPVLVGDAARIRQILFNLLWNAVKFTSHGSIQLHCGLHTERQPLHQGIKKRGAKAGLGWRTAKAYALVQGDGRDGRSVQKTPGMERPWQEGDVLQLVFRVSDTGEGVKADELDTIFTEFYQLASRRCYAGEGVGLGLPICKNLCGLMGGEIAVESEYGKGSVFTVFLPQRVGNSAMPPETMHEAAMLEGSVRLPGTRVLVVDDLPDNRRIIEGLLKPYDMTVHAAARGKDALALAAVYSYDLIFMDYLMQGDMDGLAAAKAMRKLQGYAATPIIALTANAVHGAREFFLGQGLQDYIPKPIDPALLHAVIVRWAPQDKVRNSGSVKPPQRCAKIAPEEVLVSGAAPDPVPERVDNLPGVVLAEVAEQRLDLLQHYCRHFENALTADKAYCAKFASLMEALHSSDICSLFFPLSGAEHTDSRAARAVSPYGDETAPFYSPEEGAYDTPEAVRAGLASLAMAGRQGDLATIRRLLPAIYSALTAGRKKACTARANCRAAVFTASGDTGNEGAARLGRATQLDDILSRLERSLAIGDSHEMEAAMAELKDMPGLASLPEVRELYICLYDRLLMGELEKASGVLMLWKGLSALRA